MSAGSRGFSLVEIAIVTGIIGILATSAAPFAEVATRRRAELELKRSLRDCRLAIDRYVEDRARKETNTPRPRLYPRDLDELVTARYLRRVPRDPLTGAKDWRVIGTYDPPDPSDLSLPASAGEPARRSGADSTPHGNLFDLRSRAAGIALDGTEYKDW